MIRFLQTDNRMVKALIVVVIGAASVTMVLYLIPGLRRTWALRRPTPMRRFIRIGTAGSFLPATQ